MSESREWPKPETLREFAARLIAFRETLPPEQQLLLDTLLIAAVRPEWHEDIDAYWAAANGGDVQAHGQGQPGRPLQATRAARGGETLDRQRHPPSPALLQTFGERLMEFNKTLPEEQQQLHDVLLVAALRPETGEEVESYWAHYSGIRTSPNPSWYTGSGAAAWNNTSWGTAWLNY
jgi:hypothetical protein